MELRTLTHGSYPRIGSTPEEQILRKTIAQLDRGEKTEADVHAAEDRVAAVTLAEQEAAGVDVVTDGLVRWYDPVSHLAGKLAGVRIGGLLRFFDTNFYFRQPVIEGKVVRTRPLVLDEYRWAAKKAVRPVKPVLTGPYTLARLSLREPGAPSFTATVEALADALAAEVAALAGAGARLIQIDEPALLQYPRDARMAAEAFARIAAHKGRAELALALYFGDAAPLYKTLLAWPVDVLLLDFTYSPDLPLVVAGEACGRQIGFGLLDGRNTRLEDRTLVLRQLEAMLRKCQAPRAYLTTSCGLEYLPRARARAKLQHLGALKREFAGGVQ